MAVSRIPANVQKPTRQTTPFLEFSPYENGRKRRLRFDINALADFEQETGMGFAQLMRQKAAFASVRAMLWAGLKFEDRGLTIEQVGDLIGEYLKDENVALGDHSVDGLLSLAIEAAVTQGALGRLPKIEPDAEADAEEQKSPDPNVLEGEVATVPSDSTPTNQ